MSAQLVIGQTKDIRTRPISVIKAESENISWDNMSDVASNTLAPHSYLVPNAVEIIENVYSHNSPLVLSLNGTWKFKLVAAKDLQHDFVKIKFNPKWWGNINVPSNWQVEKFDKFHYINGTYPFPFSPPSIDVNHNTVGCYRKEFNLPDDWNPSKHHIFFRVANVESLCCVWINEHFVGYSKMGNSLTEFELTQYLKKGDNVIALEVYHYSNMSYLTVGNGYDFSGIFGDVSLVARPQVYISDYIVKSALHTSNYKDGVFSTLIMLNKMLASEAKDKKISVKVYDKDRILFSQSKAVVSSLSSYRFSKTFPNITSWNSERPYLYTLVVSVTDKKGKVYESVSHKMGFRTIEIKHRQIMINGSPVSIKGVNWQEHNMVQGNVLSKENILNDIKLMRDFNINAVRLSHPAPDDFYNYCDEYGIYVFDVADIQIRPNSELLDKKEWTPMFLNQVQGMFERNKNHCSIISWTVANGDAVGDNLDLCFKWLAGKDRTRAICYDSSPLAQIYVTSENFGNLSLALKKYKKTPFIHKKCAVMAGNGGGGLSDFWKIVQDKRELQGGFISDFADIVFKKTDKGGNEYWAFANDITGVSLVDSISYAQGMFAADRKPHPQAWEVKKVFQPVKFQAIPLSNDRVKIINRFNFTDLANVRLVWKIKADGKYISQGELPIFDLAPGSSKDVDLPINNLSFEQGTTYLLRLEAYKSRESQQVSENDLIAWDQFPLPKVGFTTKAPIDTTRFIENEEDPLIELSKGNFTIVVNKKSGKITSMMLNSVEYFKDGFEPLFWRVPIDGENQGYKAMKREIWRTQGARANVTEFTTQYLPNNDVEFEFTYALTESKSKLKVSYLVKKTPEILVRYNFIAGNREMSSIPRVGLRALVQQEFNQATWLGRGPMDNYSNRKEAASIDLYQMPVVNMYYSFPRAQESGTRTDVQWMALTNKDGAGLMIKGNSLSVSALCFDISKLEPIQSSKIVHGNMIEPQDSIWWSIDLAQKPLPDNNMWRDSEIPFQNYQYEFSLTPFPSGTNLVQLSKK